MNDVLIRKCEELFYMDACYLLDNVNNFVCVCVCVCVCVSMLDVHVKI
jgi:hypothetical protein